MLDNRKKRILQAIVDEYINTAEPVSSGSIVNKYGLDLSVRAESLSEEILVDIYKSVTR